MRTNSWTTAALFGAIGLFVSATTSKADAPPLGPVEDSIFTSVDVGFVDRQTHSGIVIPDGLDPVEQSPRSAPMTCEKLLPTIVKGGFTDPVLVATDADIIPGGTGTRACVYWDTLLEVYGVYPINQASLAAFKQTKAELLPLLPDAGIELCKIAYFMPTGKVNNLNEFHDVGQPCAPEVISHGKRAEARADEVRAALALVQARTQEMFGWTLTWPLRVQVYENRDDFVEGGRVDVGALKAEQAARQAQGLAVVQTDKITAIMLELTGVPQQEDLLRLVAHEFHHIVQSGVVGSSANLPQFVIEGGADFFAGLIVGDDQRQLKQRFQSAVDAERLGKDKPLSKLITSSTDIQAYERGRAALKFLSLRWGDNWFVDLYARNIDGSPDAYLFNLSSVTGLTLDEFDREMNAWLRTFPSSVMPKPSPTPRPPAATPRPR